MKRRNKQPNNNNVAYVYNILNISKAQDKFFVDNFGCSRFLYNQLVIATQTNTSRLTVRQYKLNNSFLYGADSLALYNAEIDFVESLAQVKKNSLAELHKRKKYNKEQSYKTNNQVMKNGNHTLKLIHKNNKMYVKLPSLKELVEINYSYRLQGHIKSATVKRDCYGNYSIAILTDRYIHPLPKTGRSCSIDMGIANFYDKVDSDGDVEASKQLNFDKLNKRKIKLQRSMANKRHVNSKIEKVEDKDGKITKNIKYRSFKDVVDENGITTTVEVWTDYYIPSNNYNKVKKKHKETCETVTNRNTDKAHKEIINIIRNNDKVCIETLAIKNLQQTNNLAGKRKKNINKKLQQLPWGKWRNILSQKCNMYGRELIMAPPYYPSSQLCSDPYCNYQNTILKLSDREWLCPSCNTFHSRDENACLNLLKYMSNDIHKYEIIYQKYLNNTQRGGSPSAVCPPHIHKHGQKKSLQMANRPVRSGLCQEATTSSFSLAEIL